LIPKKEKVKRASSCEIRPNLSLTQLLLREELNGGRERSVVSVQNVGRGNFF
jgi:hypothetical protein